MAENLAQQRWQYTVFGSMFAFFAFIALMLSAVGLYAVTAYSVTQRTQEIGVRMALGAQSSQVLWLFQRRILVQLAIGVVIGLAGAVGVGKLLRGVLVRTEPTDLVDASLDRRAARGGRARRRACGRRGARPASIRLSRCAMSR